MQSEIIETTERLYQEHPDGARGTPAVEARLADGRAALTAGSYAWHADLPPALGGTGSAPSPTQYLLGALAACAVVFVHDTLGPQLGIPIDDVTALARCRADARGLLGMEGAVPDLEDIEVAITVTTTAPGERLAHLERVWRERCPIYLAVVKANPAVVRLTRTTGSVPAT